MTEGVKVIRSLPRQVCFDDGRHWRAKLGFVLLAMEQTVEDDVFRLTPPGVGVHFTRLPMSNDATADNLKAMEPRIVDAASLLLPDADLDVVCYTCNCGTMVIGEERVLQALARGRPGAKPTTVMTGVIRALHALDARRIVVATPYLDEVNAFVWRFLTDHGFEIRDLQGLNIQKNSDIDRVPPDSLQEFAKSLDRPDAEAIFICCGALRALDIAGALERDVGKPVVVSNQAMMWDCLRLAGVDDVVEGYGRLLQLDRQAWWRAVERTGAAAGVGAPAGT